MPSPEGGRVLPPPGPGAIHVDGHQRQDLLAGWEAAACAPDAFAAPGDLDGLDWTPASVPGTAAGALRDAGRWSYFEPRDFDAEDWWFRTAFEAAPGADGEVVLLRLDGIATFHEVFLNGERVGAGESMFASAAIDVGARLREGRNELAIRCLALNEKLGRKRKPRARWRTKVADNRLRFVRTMLLGRCPGFAPGPAAVGPWRPVWIERRRTLAVTGLAVRARCEGADGVLAVEATVAGLGGFEVSAADVVLGGAAEAEGPLEVGPRADGTFGLSGRLRVPEAPRWWPHTHGEPALCEVRLRVAGPEGEVGIDVGRVGFREIGVAADGDRDVTVDGLDLHLNGVRVFVRGAVWTPDDFVGMAPSRERLREALERVRDAGMNMVRIPGLGAYESPAFHDLCDELGILVWQDFAFANFDYPIEDEEFRAAVEAEAGEALAALAGRPSAVVFCGNSEVEQQAAMLGLDPGIGRGELFGSILPRALAESFHEAIYVPSSPSGGSRPFVPGVGIANYFGVGGYRRPLSDARLAEVRFAGECLAFANVPDRDGVEALLPEAPADVVVHHPRWKAGVPRDAGSGWDFDDIRDHYLGEIFGVDAGELRRYDHERYLELSRSVPGAAMAATFGEWRRPGSPCGGGIVLWLRDLVPGAGWGLVDHSGTPKRALRELGGALAPVAVWMTDEGLAGVGVHLANDRPEPLRADLRVALYANGEQRVGEASVPVEIGPHASASHDLEALLGGFRDASWAYRFGPPAQDTIVASLERGGGDGEAEVLSRAFFHPVGPPTGVEDAAALGLAGEATSRLDGALVVRLHARRAVYGLELSAAGKPLQGRGSYLHLEPGRSSFVVLPPIAGDPKIAATAVNMAGSVSIPFDPPTAV
jgi:beta-mannosidase